MLAGTSESRILHVGCGNSQLGRWLHDAGYLQVPLSSLFSLLCLWSQVTNVDYSGSDDLVLASSR